MGDEYDSSVLGKMEAIPCQREKEIEGRREYF